MAEKSIFWTTGATGDGASSYTQAEVIRWMRQMWLGDNTDEGVQKNYENELSASGATTPVVINTGAAVVYGFPYWNTTTVNVAIPTPAGSTRVDLIVLRADWTAQTVRITRIAGTEGAGPPALTQTDGVLWDLPLWQASITTGGAITLTDQRVFVHPNIAVDENMIDASVAGSGLDGGDGTPLGIAALGVTLGMMASNSVDHGKITTSVAGAGLAGGGGSPLSVNAGDGIAISGDDVETDPDGVTLENSGGQIQVKDQGISYAKAGSRLMAVLNRQGLNSSQWSSGGSSNFTPGQLHIEFGCARWTGSANHGTIAVTYSTAIKAAYDAWILATGIYVSAGGINGDINVDITSSLTTGCTLRWRSITGLTYGTVDINWLMIGEPA